MDFLDIAKNIALVSLPDSSGPFGGLVGLVVGLILGSFAGMASWRWPRELSWLSPSSCPSCGQKIGFWGLVPVFSYVFQDGKSRCCQKPVSPRYLFIEALAGLILGVWGWSVGLGVPFLALSGLVWAVVFLTAVDFETGYIPDLAHGVIAICGFFWFLNSGRDAADLVVSFLQLAGVGIFLALVYAKFRGKEMLGWGDVKLMAVAALWIPAQAGPAFLLLSGGFGLLFGFLWQKKGRGEVFPFGPSLALGLILLISWQVFVP